MLVGKRILITGGAGFIGTHLCRALYQQNHLVVLDTLRRNALGPSGLENHPRIELRRGDVRELSDVRAAIQDWRSLLVRVVVFSVSLTACC